MESEEFDRSLERMKQACVIQDPCYWDVELEEGETPLAPLDPLSINLRTKEGFIVTVCLMDAKPFMCNLNCYVFLPRGLHMEPWIKENPSYEAMQDYLEMYDIELTYSYRKEVQYGWDHGHSYDANLGIPQVLQVQKKVSGPVQVLEEARSFIHQVMTKENEIIRGKKRERMASIEEDLIKKVLHPDRVKAWVEQGFDPFE
jgi:hypothetical protein